ncbi:MAG: hypothetical protein ACRDUV_16840 [Pseudonocardiaceae bacterium]
MASSPDDKLLAHAWLAQVRAGQDELVEAAQHARIALQGRRPLELDTTVALLKILSGSLDQEIALDAATALVERAASWCGATRTRPSWYATPRSPSTTSRAPSKSAANSTTP